MFSGNEFTVFAPTDKAFNDYKDHLLDLGNQQDKDTFQSKLVCKEKLHRNIILDQLSVSSLSILKRGLK